MHLISGDPNRESGIAQKCVTCRAERFRMRAEEAAKLARAATQAALSVKGRLQIIRRIAEATSAAKHAPTMRAKAIKALSGVVKADTSLLALPEIQHSINSALKVNTWPAPCSRQGLSFS